MTGHRGRAIATATAALIALTATSAVGGGHDRPGRGHGDGPPGGTPPGHDRALTAEETVAAMQPGWNLGNSFDAIGADETAWGNPVVTPELIDAVADEGFRSIRIPVTFGQHQGGAPDHTIDPAFLDRVTEVVDQALDADLYVLLDVHHDSWQWINQAPARPDEVTEQFTALWEQIAARFADHPDELLFESINEPQFDGVDDDGADAVLHDLNVAFHEVVRSAGGNNDDRLLVLPTLHTNDEQPRLDALVETFDVLDDPNLAATVHFYGYWPFSANVAGGTHFDDVSKEHMAGAFDRLEETLVSQGIPVILGEYGLLGFDQHTGTIQQGEKLKFFEALGHHARTAGVTTMLWDNGQHLGRTSFEWSDPELSAMISTSWTVRSGTASTDQVFVRGGTATPGPVELEPHGHQFTGLSLDGKRLTKGRDYVLDGTSLQLTTHLIDTVSDRGSYGPQADLTVHFSRGEPWRLTVVAYDDPVLADVTGTTADFAIPTRFRGDQVATVEAYYTDDWTNAGPHAWTPFKEYGQAFAPDESAGEIRLQPAFFDEVDDGREVLLVWHFWSGARMDYSVTVSGDEVIGSAD